MDKDMMNEHRERGMGNRDRGAGRGGYASKAKKAQMPFFKKKVCRFCKGQYQEVTYKDFDILKRFISERGKILPRRMTGTCAKHQNRLANAIKRARTIAILPFVSK